MCGLPSIRPLALLATVLVYTGAHAELNTAEILERSGRAIASCIDWKIIGSCFWLHCSLDGCRVRTSVKVAHYRPDLLVTVQPEPTRQPWIEARALLSALQMEAINATASAFSSFLAGSSHSPSPANQYGTRNLRFFEADVIGHPLDAITQQGTDWYLCDAVTTPLVPYYQSAFDAIGWRDPTLDQLRVGTWLIGKDEIGNWPLSTWGSTYPRIGWVNQASIAKAAGVLAHRASVIATGRELTRIHLNIPGGRNNLQPPPQVRSNDPSTGKFQMIHPKVDDDCETFGSNAVGWDVDRVNTSHTFAWNLWRRYKCCPRRGQRYLGDLEF